MGETKRYTTEQLQDAESLAKFLAKAPEDQRNILLIAANSFMAGLEAGARMTPATAEAR